MSNFIIPTDGLEEKFKDQFKKLKSTITSPNVLLLGQTGVGKSSLINCIFGKKLAEISNVKPETRGFHMFSQQDLPVNIIDSEGYELETCEQYKTLLEEYINGNFTDLSKQIHIAWFCININNNRVLQFELDTIKYLQSKNIPVCVVLTQCDNDTPEGTHASELANVIKKNFGSDVPCFQVCNDKKINKELDLEDLLKWSEENISDENLKLGFVIAQKASIDVKYQKAKSRIKYYAGVAAAIAASPIPGSDAPLLVAEQTKMAVDIFSIYGLDSSFSSIVKSIIGSQLISVIGKTTAGNLLKLLPGLGSIAGVLINGTVASSITYSLGKGLCVLAKDAMEACLDENDELLKQIFSESNIKKVFSE